MIDAYLRFAYPLGALLLLAGFLVAVLSRCAW